jgi:DNA-binding MarR family transcriptional regulator
VDPVTSRCGIDPRGVPLSRLFAMAFRRLGDDLQAQMIERGWPWIRPVHGYVLLILRRRPTTATEISALLGVTKQATSKLIDQMVEERLLARSSCCNDARAKILRLTPRGWELLTEIESATEEIEQLWAQVLGDQRLQSLRTDLWAVLCPQEDADLPATRPIW